MRVTGATPTEMAACKYTKTDLARCGNIVSLSARFKDFDADLRRGLR